jgi:hypothetical protein
MINHRASYFNLVRTIYVLGVDAVTLRDLEQMQALNAIGWATYQALVRIGREGETAIYEIIEYVDPDFITSWSGDGWVDGLQYLLDLKEDYPEVLGEKLLGVGGRGALHPVGRELYSFDLARIVYAFMMDAVATQDLGQLQAMRAVAEAIRGLLQSRGLDKESGLREILSSTQPNALARDASGEEWAPCYKMLYDLPHMYHYLLG